VVVAYTNDAYLTGAKWAMSSIYPRFMSTSAQHHDASPAAANIPDIAHTLLNSPLELSLEAALGIIVASKPAPNLDREDVLRLFEPSYGSAVEVINNGSQMKIPMLTSLDACAVMRLGDKAGLVQPFGRTSECMLITDVKDSPPHVRLTDSGNGLRQGRFLEMADRREGASGRSEPP
jgi:hypothetical protein